MQGFSKQAKRVAIDGAGYLCILLGILFGWVPGPGGIPLILAGLGLLSINNTWAKRLKDFVAKNGGKLTQKIFPDHGVIQLLYDIFCLFLVAIIVAIILTSENRWTIVSVTFLGATALLIFSINRSRWDRLKKYFTKKH